MCPSQASALGQSWLSSAIKLDLVLLHHILQLELSSLIT